LIQELLVLGGDRLQVITDFEDLRQVQSGVSIGPFQSYQNWFNCRVGGAQGERRYTSINGIDTRFYRFQA
jgi:hypothetical protein